jgi:hypothetical protein
MHQFQPNELKDVMIRWELALEYLKEVQINELSEEHALLVLIGRDFPEIIRELTRLRPELQHIPKWRADREPAARSPGSPSFGWNARWKTRLWRNLRRWWNCGGAAEV